MAEGVDSLFGNFQSPNGHSDSPPVHLCPCYTLECLQNRKDHEPFPFSYHALAGLLFSLWTTLSSSKPCYPFLSKVLSVRVGQICTIFFVSSCLRPELATLT